MWRAFFLAVGISCCLLGVEAMAVEKAILNVGSESTTARAFGLSQSTTFVRRELVPPDWAPWSLVSVGAVVILYSFSIPRRVGKE